VLHIGGSFWQSGLLHHTGSRRYWYYKVGSRLPRWPNSLAPGAGILLIGTVLSVGTMVVLFLDLGPLVLGYYSWKRAHWTSYMLVKHYCSWDSAGRRMVAAVGCYSIVLPGMGFPLNSVFRNFLWSSEYPK
jgi:hypothetical protein